MEIETKADIMIYGLIGLIALAHWYIDIYEWIKTELTIIGG